MAVCVSFSGGKDSTVLLHLVRSMYPEVEAVFSDTGLEYPEIREFVKSIQNVTWVKPNKTFKQVIEEYGYPIISKEQSSFIQEYRDTKSEKLRSIRINGNKYGRGKISNKWKFLLDAPFKISDKCCDFLKKQPLAFYEKQTGNKSFIGIMAAESDLREQSYIIHGCNAFNTKRPQSRPIIFWLEQDVWEYIKLYRIPYSTIYDKGESRTGCTFCMFGCHKDKQPNKFQRMKITHPELWNYCINKLNLKQVLDYIKVPYE